MLSAIIREFVSAKIRKKELRTELDFSDEEIREWLCDTSKKAHMRTFVTHIPKVVHPDARISPVIVKGERENDGYIKTANVPQFLDSVGNALALPATSLLALDIDGKPFYQHLIENTEVAEDFVEFIGKNGEEVKADYLKALSPSVSNKTDSNVRQVYFPVDSKDGYYIITPLPSSSVLHRFSTLLKKNNEYNKNPDSSTSLKADTMETKGLYLDGGYWKLPGLVSISYGGDKPQNVSDDNLRIGRHQLMKCLPPKIRRRSITIPQWSFFTESVFSKESRYKELFVALDRIYKCPRNNMDIRNTRDEYLLTLLEEISTDIASVRYEISFKKGPYKGSLDPAEYMMLYEDEKRYESDEWLRAMCEKFAKWFFDTYKKSVKKPFEFGEGEFHVVRDFAFDNKEVFIA